MEKKKFFNHHDSDSDKEFAKSSRRNFLRNSMAGVGSLLLACNKTEPFSMESFLQKNFLEMDNNEKKALIERLEIKYQKKYGKKFNIETTEPIPGILFGYGLDLSRCIGCRRCVYACVDENNQNRNPQIHWITVLRFKKGEKWVNDLEKADKYYNPEIVPEEGFFYMPVQCQQCINPPCVKVCPTQATWMDKDGIVVIDYDYCIGCRFCMAACPYGARRFNWAQVNIPEKELNTNVHVLGNRPRQKGVVEKCSFCIQRTRKGRYPACVEICPTGSRKFGNLLDKDSEIRYCIDQKRVFRLKEELNTEPKFYYFFAT